MSAATSQRKYAGRGIAELRTGRARSRIPLPDVDTATLLPDPRAAVDALRARFRDVSGPQGQTHAFPNMSARDVRAFANVMTAALRNDLPSIDVYDAAVIWEKWRQAVVDARDLLRSVRDDSATNETSPDVWNACIILDHRSWDIRESLATALVTPREVSSRYCPWAADFFTHERLHPESV